MSVPPGYRLIDATDDPEDAAQRMKASESTANMKVEWIRLSSGSYSLLVAIRKTPDSPLATAFEGELPFGTDPDQLLTRAQEAVEAARRA